MTSRRRGGPSDSTTKKKKFGKNLNTLTKPPAPPISGSNAKTSGSSRNGLLLLSTKRASSGGASGAAAGLLSSKTTSSPTKPMQPLGLTTESYSSAHDALLGAVIGASIKADAQQPPDAWGVAEKQPSSMPESETDSPGKTNVSYDAASETPGGDGQASAMTDRAREKAEQRRTEEESKFDEQKDRAAELLRQLEQKMSAEKGSVPPSEEDTINHSQQPDYLGHEAERVVSRERPTVVRTLYDPNRPYSSTVGNRPTDETLEPGQIYEPSVSVPANGRGLTTPGNVDMDAEQPSKPMIHISSYEDRDRGEQSIAGPRMLFDPKSGSMVAVSSSDSAGGRGKKGAKPKSRKDRESSREKAAGDGENGAATTKTKRTTWVRKDDTANNRRDRRHVDDNDQVTIEESKPSKARAGKSRPTESRLPRTCGVLYKRDERGNIRCADGCDGDHGYGCHSVRGGRARNPEEYAKLNEQEQQPFQLDVNGMEYGAEGMGYEDDNAYYASYDTDGAAQKADAQDEPVPEKEIEYVKADEKIELVTGIDESPSLKASASPFAPSQAALAAAAAAREHHAKEGARAKPPVDLDLTSDDAEDSDDNDHPSFVGLGFDPTENMDSVMRSPKLFSSTADKLGAVGISSLALDPQKPGDPPTRNIFAFGSSATWGTGGASSDWAMTLGATPGGAKGVGSEGQDEGVTGSSFLSLSSGAGVNPWGSPGLPGLRGSGNSGANSSGD